MNFEIEIVQYDFGLRELAKNPKAIEYLLQHFAKTKEIFDMKNHLNEYLKENLPKKGSDPIIKEFAKKYSESNEMKNQGGSVVYYKTETND